MKYLPYEKYKLITTLKPGEVIQRLSDCVEPRKTFRLNLFSSNKTKPYEGQVDRNCFNITRIIGYRNSFLPNISGRIQVQGNETEIYIKMSMAIFTTIFTALWLGVVAIVGVIMTLLLFTGQDVGFGAFAPLLMFAFGYAICIGGFKYESSKSKEFLNKLFEAQKIE